MSPLSLALSNSKTPSCRIPFYYNHLTLRHTLAAKRIWVYVNGIDIFENWKMPVLGIIQTAEKHIKGQSVSCLIFHRLKETRLCLTKICETLSKSIGSFLYTHYSKRLPMDVDIYLLQTVYKTLMFASRKIYITGEIVLVPSTTGWQASATARTWPYPIAVSNNLAIFRALR